MFFRTAAQKTVFSLIAVLFAITTCKDWLDFYTCGAVNRCLVDAGVLQYVTKCSMSLLLTVLAFIVSRDAISGRDRNLLRAAFVFSFLADSCFSIIKLVGPDARDLSDILGIALFMFFQTILIYRHSRKSDSDDSFPVLLWFLFAAAAIAIALFCTGAIGLTLGNVTIALIAVYSFYLISSMVVGILAPRKGYFPAASAKCIRWGMVAFFIGDALVGLSLISGEDHSAVQLTASIAKNFIWWFYVPAQLMLIFACKKPKA